MARSAWANRLARRRLSVAGEAGARLGAAAAADPGTKAAAPAGTRITVHSPRGCTLNVYLLLPASGAPPRGLVLFLHGYGEHAGRKLAALQAVADAACAAVAAPDMAGHGLSGPPEREMRGAVRCRQHAVEDSAAVLRALCSGGPAVDSLSGGGGAPGVPAGLGALPLVLGGYSMGGGIALHLAREIAGGGGGTSGGGAGSAGTSESGGLADAGAGAAAGGAAWPRLAGLFLVSPALGLSEERPRTLLERVKLSLGQLLYRTVPLARLVKPLPTATLNADPAFVSDYDADPLVCRAGIPVCTIHTLLTAAYELSLPGATAALRDVPLYVTASPGDKVTSTPAVAAFVETHRKSLGGASSGGVSSGSWDEAGGAGSGSGSWDEGGAVAGGEASSISVPGSAASSGGGSVTLVLVPGDTHDLLGGPDAAANAAGVADFVRSCLAP